MRSDMHQIGEVAEAVGLSLRTIRHYDEVGLVPPSGRSAGGFRLYTERDIQRLRLVKLMKPLEFTLQEMRELLDAQDRLTNGVEDPHQHAQLLDRIGMYALAAQQRCRVLRKQLKAAEAMATLLSDAATEHAAPPG